MNKPLFPKLSLKAQYHSQINFLLSRFRYGTSSLSSGSELSRSRSTHALKSREPSPDRGGPDGDKEALSSWARYLKSKYGNRTTKDSPRETGASSSTPSSSYSSSSAATSSPSSTASSASRRLSLGLPLRQANEMHSSDDDSKNLQSSLASPTQHQALADGTEDTNTKFSTPRTQYLQKRRQMSQIGGRGSESGKFTWPRGISVGPENLIVVADSSNHRVQVFDANGTYLKEFGTYGNGDGEFDCLAGVAINRIGQFIIADRYNHRIQVFDPAGKFENGIK
jgi:tripartite motif-containing protein 71